MELDLPDYDFRDSCKDRCRICILCKYDSKGNLVKKCENIRTGFFRRRKYGKGFHNIGTRCKNRNVMCLAPPRRKELENHIKLQDKHLEFFQDLLECRYRNLKTESDLEKMNIYIENFKLVYENKKMYINQIEKYYPEKE